MKNMTELTLIASEVAVGLLDGSVDVKTAVEFNNSIGKVIAAQKCILAGQIASNQGMNIDIPYLQGKDTAGVIEARPNVRKLRQG
jgi:hypothetical protein